MLRGLRLGSKDDLAAQVYGLDVQAKLLARADDISAALALAEHAHSLAATSGSPAVQGNAALNLAEARPRPSGAEE